MATDRDEQQRQQQELEEIRRSFAEMGARGLLFEPAEADESERARQSTQPARVPTPPAFQARPRWWWAAALALLFVAGTPSAGSCPRVATTRGGGAVDRDDRQPVATATTVRTPTVVSVPESCLDAAQLADEIISKLNRNDRDNRLALNLRTGQSPTRPAERRHRPDA